MNDKELLELAAKAAGIQVRGLSGYDTNEFCRWNPLTDDGDALRLAVKLKISIVYDDSGYVTIGDSSYSGPEVVLTGDSGVEDICRAIVRAAAEIGKALP